MKQLYLISSLKSRLFLTFRKDRLKANFTVVRLAVARFTINIEFMGNQKKSFLE